MKTLQINKDGSLNIADLQDKVLLVLGTITFEYFTEDELTLFKLDKERKALVHKIDALIACDSEEDALELGEEAIGMGFDSYLVPSVFLKPNNAEIVYEQSLVIN